MNSITFLLVFAAVGGAMGIPLILRIVPPNDYFGFRTTSTLSNRALWYRVNYFGGWSLLIAAIASAALIFVAPNDVPDLGVWFVLVPLIIAVGVSMLYLGIASGSAASGNK
jgi:uncharacterized membrane protein